jgi:hypothetical protein
VVFPSMDASFDEAPNSRNASARLFCRGYAASLRKMRDAVTVPCLIDEANRKMSAKCCSMSLTLIAAPHGLVT